MACERESLQEINVGMLYYLNLDLSCFYKSSGKRLEIKDESGSSKTKKRVAIAMLKSPHDGFLWPKI